MFSSTRLQDQRTWLCKQLDFRWRSYDKIAYIAVGTFSKAAIGDGESFNGKYNGQFFLFHPACTIIYAPGAARSSEFDSYITKCVRTNFTSIVELATLQRHFASIIQKYIQRLSEDSSYLLSNKAKMEQIFDQIGRNPLLLHWKLGGAHNIFLGTIMRKLGLVELLDKTSTEVTTFNKGKEEPDTSKSKSGFPGG
jgi:hypothetical protein